MDVSDPATGSGPDDHKQFHQVGPTDGDGPLTGNDDSSHQGIQAQVEKGASVEKCIEDSRATSSVETAQSQPAEPSADSSHASSQSATSSFPNSSPSSYISFGSMIHEPNKVATEAGQDRDKALPKDNISSSKGTAATTSKGKTLAAVDSSYVDAAAGTKSAPTPNSAPQPAPAVANIPWATDSVGPPSKIPIRFMDCVGRHYIIPWEKAKTWKEMKKIINTAFTHIEGLGPRVLAGNYDLVIHDLWIDPIAVALKTALANYQPPEHFDPLGTVIASLGISPGALGPSSSNTTTTAAAVAAAAAAQQTSMLSHILPKPCKGTFIMTEFWDELIQPGMTIKMLAWPPSTRRTVNQSPLRVTIPPPPRAKTRKRQIG